MNFRSLQDTVGALASTISVNERPQQLLLLQSRPDAVLILSRLRAPASISSPAAGRAALVARRDKSLRALRWKGTRRGKS